MRTNRITSGLRKPGAKNVAARPPRQEPLDPALVLLLRLKPWAAPRLPDEVLSCFDHEQRQIRALPGERPRGAQGVPEQRRPHPLERLEAQRARRR